MATYKEISDAIKRMLAHRSSRAVLQLNSATRERSFEVYVFSLVVEAVRRAGGTASLKGINSGPNPNPIVFRGSPGYMASQAQDFAYAECQLNQRTFEIHVGVQYVGTSGALHEVDVSVFDHERAKFVRNTGVLPNTPNLRAGIECKFYDSTLGVSLGRTFVGLVSDLGGLKVKAFASNGRSPGLAEYFSKSDRPQPFFALSPMHSDSVERFVRTVEQDLRKWCGVY